MLTCPSNQTVGKVHERMPVILPKGVELDWLGMKPDEAKTFLRPYSGKMSSYEISKDINSSKVDSPELVKPKNEKETLLGYLK